MEANNNVEFRRLATPRAASVAGILFALLFSSGLLMIRSAIPATLSIESDWVGQGATEIKIAITLMPFAGIAFLWFVGVVRDRLGRYEDQFFSTVFFGSSLLFLSMVFVSMAIAGGILIFAQESTWQESHNDVIYFGRAMMLQISNVYALRMAGVFMISLGTIWFRTGLMPRWLAFLTLFLAIALLLVINLSAWVTFIFPGWVLVISLFILVKNVSGDIHD